MGILLRWIKLGILPLLLLGIHGKCLFALHLADSAAASALNGLNLLSEDADIYANDSSSIRFGSQNLYSHPGLYLSHLRFSFPSQSRLYGCALLQLNGSDYQNQDFKLYLAQDIAFVRVLLAQRLVLESIASDISYQTWQSDIGLQLNFRQLQCRLEMLSAFAAEEEIKLGIVHPINDKILLGMGFRIDEYGDESWQIGSSCRLSNRFTLLSSWQNEPSRLGLAAQLSLSHLHVVYAIRTHPNLQLSHAVDLGYRW